MIAICDKEHGHAELFIVQATGISHSGASLEFSKMSRKYICAFNTYVYMYVCMCVYTCVRIYVKTYIHTCIQLFPIIFSNIKIYC
jgi:hypothetical protein